LHGSRVIQVWIFELWDQVYHASEQALSKTVANSFLHRLSFQLSSSNEFLLSAKLAHRKVNSIGTFNRCLISASNLKQSNPSKHFQSKYERLISFEYWLWFFFFQISIGKTQTTFSIFSLNTPATSTATKSMCCCSSDRWTECNKQEDRNFSVNFSALMFLTNWFYLVFLSQ
jgi:hypothetical protein